LDTPLYSPFCQSVTSGIYVIIGTVNDTDINFIIHIHLRQ